MNEPSKEEVTRNTPPDNASAKDVKPNSGKHSGYSIILIGVLSAVLTMPLFMLVYKYIPALEISFGEKILRLDHILLFILIFAGAYYLLRKFRMIVYIAVIGGALLIMILHFSGKYKLENLYHDYAQFLYNLSENSFSSEFSVQGAQFSREGELREAI